MNRLGEAKGAVELLLADCYVRRDQVALIAFRGTGAQLLLLPTGSLLRAKRSLAGLPGGGPTPLAAGIDAPWRSPTPSAVAARTPIITFLTDARANMTRDGSGGRPKAEAEAMESARALRATGIAALMVDTSPRPNPFARTLAAEMGARYRAAALCQRRGAVPRGAGGARHERAPSWERDGRDWPNRAFSRFVEAGGLRWHVQVMGQGPVALLLHGTGASTHSFRDLAPLLARQFTVVAPDLPGHGFTAVPSSQEGYTLPGVSAGIGALLDVLGLRRRSSSLSATRQGRRSRCACAWTG